MNGPFFDFERRGYNWSTQVHYLATLSPFPEDGNTMTFGRKDDGSVVLLQKQWPKRPIITEGFIRHASPDYVEWSRFDGQEWRLLITVANGQAEYDAEYDVALRAYRCRLLAGEKDIPQEPSH